jgi:putative membrane protein
MLDNTSLFQPQRQSPVAIILTLAKAIVNVARQAFPLLIIAFVGNSDYRSLKILLVTVAISLISTVVAFIRYFTTYYFIQDEYLVLHTGWLSKSKVNIPLSRVQSINFEQNILYRFFDVVKIYADSAGSDKREFELTAIGKKDAEALRYYVISYKDAQKDEEVGETTVQDSPKFHSDEQIIISYDPLTLVKIGLTENHLRSGWLVIVAIFWVYSQFEEIGIKVEDQVDVDVWYSALLNSFAVLMVLLALMSVAISLVRTFVKNYDFKFIRTPHGFKVVKGLFNRIEVAASDQKIQFISWSQNILQKYLAYNTLKISQAGIVADQNKKGLSIPGCLEPQIDYVQSHLFGHMDTQHIHWSRISMKYVWRYATILGIIACLTIIYLWFAGRLQFLGITIIIYAFLVYSRYLRYKKIKFGTNLRFLLLHGGTWGARKTILPMYKIQNVQLRSSPYLRRHNLSTMIIYTAAGSLSLPYIPNSTAMKLCDIFLFRIESDTRSWM